MTQPLSPRLRWSRLLPTPDATAEIRSRQPRGRWRAGLLAAALGLLSAGAAKAQVSTYSFAQSSGTYTPISGGTNISFPVEGTTAWDDDVQTITPGSGFSFTFNGVAYTSFRVNTNGYITFGTTAPSTTNYAPISSTAGYAGAVVAYARDLVNNGAAISWVMQGTAPNRTVVVQWNNARRYNSGAVTGDVLNFQIRLNETTNTVQLVYGTNTATSTTALTGQVGLRGTANTDFNNRSTSTDWSATTAGGTNAATVTTRNTIMPASGLTFTYSPPTCFVPTGITVVPNSNTTSANVSFTAPTSGTAPVGYNYQYRLNTGPGAWVGPFPSASTSFNITGLSAGTSYDVQIQSNCGGGDLSAWSAITTFTTLCSPTTATLTQNFESTTGSNLPACWNRIVAGTGALVQSTGNGTPMGTRQAQLTAATAASTSNRSILILPPLADLGSGSPLQLRFRAKATTAGATLRVGTINNVGPAGAFTDLQLALPLTTAYQDFNVDYTAYAGSNTMIAFRHGQDEGGSGTTIYLDNVSWEPRPACPSPTALTAGSPTGTTMNLSFSPQGANQVDIFWTTSSSQDPNVSTAGGTLQPGITGTTYTATGLSGLTTYYFWIRSACGGGGSSVFVGPASATTLAAPLNVNVTRTPNAGFTSIVGQPGTVDISSWRTTSGTFYDDENLSNTIPLPFPVQYLGTTFSTSNGFAVSTNGFLTFNTATTSNGYFLNSAGYWGDPGFLAGTSTPQAIQTLAPFFDDLGAVRLTGETVPQMLARVHKYQVSGTSPNRVLTVEWNNTSRYANSGASLTFQIKIYENATNTNNKIEFWYGTMTAYNGTTTAPAWNYVLGMSGANTNQLIIQQQENTNYFQNAAKLLTITPSCDTKYEFIQGTPYTGTPPAAATAPSNDAICNAIALGINNVSTPATQFCTYYTSALATASGQAACSSNNPDDDVWFTATTPNNGSTLNLQVRVGGSDGYTPTLQIYTSSNGTCSGTLTQVGTCSAGTTGQAVSQTLTASPNTTYFIRVYHAGAGSGTRGQFAIDAFGLPNPPANDNCASAVALGNTKADCGAVGAPTTGTTFAATNSSVTTTCGGTPTNDVWYTFVVPAGPAGTTGALVSVTGITSTMAPSFEILSGTCGSLTSVVCASTSTGGGTASIAQKLAPGTYYVRVYNGVGQFTICAQTAIFVGNDDATDATAGSPYDLTPTATCTPTTNGTTVNAAGPYMSSSSWSSSPDDDVWYTFLATTATTNITVVPTSPTFETVVEAFDVQPAAGSTVTELSYADVGVGLSTTLELTGLTIGNRYWFRVFSSGTTERSAFTVCVQEVVPPANDEPSAAPLLTSSTNCVTTLGTTIGASNTTTGPGGQAGAADLNPAPWFFGTISSANDVWYRFTTSGASSSRTITVEPTATNNTTFDPVIQVLTYDAGTNTYTEVDYMDDIVAGAAEALTLTGLAAGTYYVRVYNTQDFGTTNGDFTICVTNGAKFLQVQPNVIQGPTTTVGAGTTNNHIVTTEIIVGGATGTLPWTSATFRAVNTANIDVTTAKLWQSSDLTFTPGVDTQVSTNATINGSGDIVFNNISTDLPIGATYFFLTYDINIAATAGNTVDAQVQVNKFTIGGNTYPSSLKNPTGNRTITPPPPAFDQICGYVTLPVALNGANVTYQQYSTQGSTAGTPAPTCQTNIAGDVWFRVPVPATRNLYISVIDGATAPITVDQVVEVFSSSNNQCTGTLTQLGCNDDGGVSVNPAIGLTGIANGVSYAYIRVAIWGGATVTSGNFRIAVSDRPLFTGGASTAFDTGGPNSANFFPQFDVASTLQGATITIPAGLTNNPVMASSQTVGGLVIASGASFALNGTATLTVGNGGFTNRGTFTQATGATVLLSGTSPVSVGNSGAGQPTMTFENLSIGANGASLAGPVDVRRVLTLGGTLTTNGKKLTLVSNATTSAMVVNNTGGGVTGNVTVQRYIDPSISTTPTTYRHLSAPVTTTVSDLATASPYFVPRTNPAYNADTTALPFPTVFRYDETRISTARPRFVDGYFSPNAGTSPLRQMVGYSVLMPDGANPDFVGPLNNGNYTSTTELGPLDRGPLVNQGWHLLGNPYPAPIDWATVTNGQIPNMNGAISVLRSTDPNSAAYVSYTNGVGSAKYLGVAQGFLIRTQNVGTPGSVSLTNSNRVTTYQNPAVYRTAQETRPLVKLTLVESGKPVQLGDEAYVYFQNGATPVADQYYDAFKIRSTGVTPSLFSVAGNEELSINGLPAFDPTVETQVPLGLQVGVSGSYKLNLAELVNFPAGMPVVLRDAVTGTEQDLTQNPLYSFTMDANFRGSRFTLVFNPQGRVTGLSGLAGAQLAVWPNPVAGKAALQVELNGLPTTAKAVTAQLLDALGRVVAERTLAAVNGAVSTSLETRSLGSGVYVLKLTTGEQAVTRRIVIE